jgi:tetratricopeptide (TPR) repeat protein
VLTLAGAQAFRAAMARVPGVGLRRVTTAVVVLFIGLEFIGLRHALAVYHSQENLARASVELQPHAPDGWEWLGNHYVAVGDLLNAARCYSEAVAIEPGIERPRHNLAAALLHLGRPAEALAHSEAVASMHGVSAEGAAVAAASALELERWDEARRWLDRGLERAPDNQRLAELAAELDRRRPISPVGTPGADADPQSSR